MQRSNLAEAWREPRAVREERISHVHERRSAVTLLRPRSSLVTRVKYRQIVVASGPYRPFRIY
jgi:hypothetical protein